MGPEPVERPVFGFVSKVIINYRPQGKTQ